MRRSPLVSVVLRIGSVVALGFTCACGSGRPSTPAEPVRVDGSSTVYPLTVAVADEFKKTRPEARIDVKFSGTGAGFERFCKGESDIQDASRPIETREIEACKASGVGYIELPVALDAVTVILPASNTWALSLTTSELKTLWEPAAQGKMTRWRQLRPDWPNEPIALYGPGQKSGTFDFFTHAIVGKERASRTDYTASEDDDEIVKGVADHPYALGYVGFVHYERHRDRLKAAGIDDLDQEIGPGAIEPSQNSVRRGLYRPLARPLFVYVNTKRLDRPEVKAFVDFYTRNSEALAAKSGSIPLNSRLSALVQQRATARVEGSLFQRPDAVSRSLEQLLDQ
jgi:phosphate transport system substrate-binding protein